MKKWISYPRKINLPRDRKVRRKLRARLLARVKHVGMGGSPCWYWQGCVDPSGYPKVKAMGKTFWCHRLAYALWNGRLKEGLEIDHICRNNSCINPMHLQAVTVQENTRLRDERRRDQTLQMKTYENADMDVLNVPF